MQANVDMAMQPDGQTALHIAAEQAKIDTAMLEVNNGNLIICTKKTQNTSPTNLITIIILFHNIVR